MKIGLIGNRGHHVHVLQDIDQMAEASITSLAPGFPGEDMASLCEKYNMAVVYHNHRSLLSEDKPDVVIISTQLDRIPFLAADAAQAGCHCICEKPLATEHDALMKLWEGVTKNGTQCLAMLPNRNDPVLAAAKQAVESGRIGEVKLLNARKSYKFNDSRNPWLCKRESYGGTIPWIGIHALDFIDAIAGVPFSSVSAYHDNAGHPRFKEIEDICTMNLTMENGALASVSVDYLWPQSAVSHGDDWLRIVGTEGIIEAAMGRGECTIIDKNGHSEISFADGQPYFTPLIRDFPQTGTSGPIAETRRSFNLTHVGLCARDAADRGIIVNDLNGPWLEPEKSEGE